MTEIGIGIIGGGYMGKAHSVAMAAVGAVFNTTLRPRLEMIAATTDAKAEAYRAAYGFARGTGDWRMLVADPRVEAVVIASPQETHRAIAEAAFARGLPVFCEKPLGMDIADSTAMVAAAEAAGLHQHGGLQLYPHARQPICPRLGGARRDWHCHMVSRRTYRGFGADPTTPAHWRHQGRANGTMGDLAPHMINAALALIGPIARLSADVGTVHATRPSPSGPVAVTNDDIGQFMCRFANGAMGHLSFSRVATGRKMGYAYEIVGTTGAIRFDQEDQNALWLYRASDLPAERGFRKILTGPEHPDYLPFCQGPGHGTGYQDQIIIEARDFLQAIATGQTIWPTFRDGMEVMRVVEAAHQSATTGTWIDL